MSSQHRPARIRRRRLSTWWGKRRIDALEVLGPKLGPEPRRRRLERAEQRAADAIEPLKKWDRISDRSYGTYTNGPNVVRLQRLVELVPKRSRILDVGIGFGYVSGILLRERGPDYYCGVDLKQSYLDATASMLEANDLPRDSVTLEILDVFDIDGDFLSRHDPDLILLLEVLEHVEDPGLALRRVSAAAETGTQLLFTVPLFGRLEGVWGHLSMFERGRLEQICSSAGLRIDRAEPVANNWAMVVATVAAAPANRSRVPAADNPYSFRALSTGGSPGDYSRPSDDAEVSIIPRRAYLECVVSLSGGAPGPGEGGMCFAVRDPGILRLELELEPPLRGRGFAVRGITADRTVGTSWVAESKAAGPRTTYVLKPGRRSKALGPVETNPAGVRWIEVVSEVGPGEIVTIKLYRGAWVGRDAGGSRLKRALRERFAAD